MLADSLVEEFEIREDEPWYDQQDLQQGEPGRGRGSGGGRWAAGGGEPPPRGACEGRGGSGEGV